MLNRIFLAKIISFVLFYMQGVEAVPILLSDSITVRDICYPKNHLVVGNWVYVVNFYEGSFRLSAINRNSAAELITIKENISEHTNLISLHDYLYLVSNNEEKNRSQISVIHIGENSKESRSGSEFQKTVFEGEYSGLGLSPFVAGRYVCIPMGERGNQTAKLLVLEPGKEQPIKEVQIPFQPLNNPLVLPQRIYFSHSGGKISVVDRDTLECSIIAELPSVQLSSSPILWEDKIYVIGKDKRGDRTTYFYTFAITGQELNALKLSSSLFSRPLLIEKNIWLVNLNNSKWLKIPLSEEGVGKEIEVMDWGLLAKQHFFQPVQQTETSSILVASTEGRLFHIHTEDLLIEEVKLTDEGEKIVSFSYRNGPERSESYICVTTNKHVLIQFKVE